ncbi:unnamed protein product [Hyaloperonospora brassicae]|uniref:RxLR effector candidate protein n=1 Tax=Hyaloperonospora brassicae TaxID=162125 RepID=A0AAV0SY97_HYABA|nr:unnamed protein product [Hyaloperonospora brassicae]
MSPMAGNNGDKAAAPQGHARASSARPTSASAVGDNSPAHERGPTKRDKILTMFDALSSLSDRNETSHIRVEEDEECDAQSRAGFSRQPTSQEYSPFEALGPRFPAPPPQPQQVCARSPIAALVTAEEQKDRALEASLAAAHPPWYTHQRQHVGTSDARHRMLFVRMFDGSELYRGLV